MKKLLVLSVLFVTSIMAAQDMDVLKGDFSLNSKHKVVLGGESPGDSVGWLVWWILKKNLMYAPDLDMLLQMIVERME